MADDISEEPLARALLAKLARTRGADDPLGSLARAVLGGEVDLRTAVTSSWYERALDDAFTGSLARRDGPPASERAEIDRQARWVATRASAL
jgi:hypothetical protein